MPNPSAPALRALSEQTAAWMQQAHVPFSQKPEAAILVMKDGSWVPGVRVESASYSLAIPALLNAYTTLMTLHRKQIVAISLSRPLRPEEILFSESICGCSLDRIDESTLSINSEHIPALSGTAISPFLALDSPSTPAEGIALARSLAVRAFVPESNFPVAAILETETGDLVPGVNVENEDWSHILCAERNAIGTAVTYGITGLKSLYLTCTYDDSCSPCGACRQLLAELTPTVRLWMDRGSNPEQPSTPESLLPASFMGETLFNKLTQS